MESKRKQRTLWIQTTDGCELCSQIPSRSLVFPRAGSEEKWCGTYTDKTDGSWDRMAEEMMAIFSGSGHLIFRATSAFERGNLRSKGGSKKSIQFNGCYENIELLLCTVISSNQVSVHRAKADLCDEFPKDLGASVKPEAHDHLETMEIPTGLSNAETRTDAQQTVKLSAKIRAQIRTNVRRPEIIQTMFWCGFESCRTRTVLLYLLKQKKDNRCNIYAGNTRCLKMKKEICVRGWIRKDTRMGPVVNIKSMLSWWTMQYRS